MARRRPTLEARQTGWQWRDPTLLLAEQLSRGEVVFDADHAAEPELPGPASELRARVRRPARQTQGPKAARGAEPVSLGLPLGAILLEGQLRCWACAGSLEHATWPSDVAEPPRCPSCGSRLPVR